MCPYSTKAISKNTMRTWNSASVLVSLTFWTVSHGHESFDIRPYLSVYERFYGQEQRPIERYDVEEGAAVSTNSRYFEVPKEKKQEVHYHKHEHIHEHEHKQEHVHKHDQAHSHKHMHEQKHQHEHHDDHKHGHHHDHKHDHHHGHDHKHQHQQKHNHHHDHGHKHVHSKH